MRRVMMTSMGVAFALSLVLATGASATEEPVHAYVGATSCKMCHSKAKTGDQYGKWLETKHSKAFEVLGTDEAKAAAAEQGLEGNPQELGECLECHTTAYGVDAALIGKKLKAEQGVGCESCHGPGKDYKSKKVMQDQAASVAKGLIIPDEKTCVKCHNDRSPTFKVFDFDEYFAKIAHPNPATTK
jgi:Cytochrome c554 and c-prime